MHNRIIQITLLFIVFIFVLCACHASDPLDSQKRELKDVQAFCEEYLESMLDDASSAFDYRHYEDPEAKALATKYPQVLLNYDIISITKLSDSLWEVILFTQTEEFSDGVYGANYIGIIDDKLRVMTSVNQIPEILKEGIEIEPYEPSGPNIIDSDDIISPIE